MKTGMWYIVFGRGKTEEKETEKGGG